MRILRASRVFRTSQYTRRNAAKNWRKTAELKSMTATFCARGPGPGATRWHCLTLLQFLLVLRHTTDGSEFIHGFAPTATSRLHPDRTVGGYRHHCHPC